MPRYRLPIAATAACLVAVLPASALAATEVDYKVTYDVTVKQQQHRQLEQPGQTWSSATQLDTRLQADLGTVTFRDGELVTPAKTVPVQADHAGLHWGMYASEPVSGNRNCTPQSPSGEGEATIAPSPIPALTGVAIDLRMTDRISPVWECDVIGEGSWEPAARFATNAPIGEAPLDDLLIVPEEAIGDGKYMERLVGPAAGAEGKVVCLGPMEHTRSCHAIYDGWVTFVKTGERDTSPTTSVPEPPETPAQPTETPAMPTGDTSGTDKPAPDGFLKPLLPKSATVDAAARTLSFRAGCEGGCSGTAVLTTPAATARAARAGARLRFKVPAGAPRTLRVKLPAAVRRDLRSARRATLRLTLRQGSAAPVRARVAVRLPRG